MNNICITCDTKNRLCMCTGKDGDFKYCYRKAGSISNVPGSITPFNEVTELHDKLGEFIDKDSLRLTEDYAGDEHMCLLMAKFKDSEMGKEYPIGFVTK